MSDKYFTFENDGLKRLPKEEADHRLYLIDKCAQDLEKALSPELVKTEKAKAISDLCGKFLANTVLEWSQGKCTKQELKREIRKIIEELVPKIVDATNHYVEVTDIYCHALWDTMMPHAKEGETR